MVWIGSITDSGQSARIGSNWLDNRLPGWLISSIGFGGCDFLFHHCSTPRKIMALQIDETLFVNTENLYLLLVTVTDYNSQRLYRLTGSQSIDDGYDWIGTFEQ